MVNSSSKLATVFCLSLSAGCFQPPNEFPDAGPKKDAGPIERVCGKPGDGNESTTTFSPTAPETVGCTRFLGSLAVSVAAESDLSGLRTLREAARLYIYQNQGLRNLKGLENLNKLSELYIFENYALDDISALSGLTRLEKLSIDLNPKLKSLDGLSGIQELQELHVTDNESLASLAGLSGLIRIRGNLTLYANKALPTAEVTAFLNRVRVDGSVILQ